MANKQKKKRNKVYTGEGAALQRPTVTRISAVSRNPPSQWWLENKRIARPLLIAGVVAVVIILLVVQIVSLVNAS